jgi:hypothetical protein
VDSIKIELIGEVAHMVEAALGADSKKATACSIKVDAGVLSLPA